MITTRIFGGLGNNMFQYAIGRIVADSKNYNLAVDGLEKISRYFPNVVTINDRLSITKDILHVGYESVNKHTQNIDIDAILNHNGGIEFKGFFQNYNLYKNYKALLNTIFYYDDSHHFKPGANDIAIHVRLGDYVSLGWSLQAKTYIDILESYNISYDNCYIVTDDIYNPVIAEIAKNIDRCILSSRTHIEDMTLLRTAKRVILSQSSFSWWSTMLGDHDAIYAPLHVASNGFPWKLLPTNDDIDLIPDEMKFIKVPI